MSPDVARRGLACVSCGNNGRTWPDVALCLWSLAPSLLPESCSNANVRMLIAGGRPVSVAWVSQIEHGKVTSSRSSPATSRPSEVRLDLVADFGDRTVRLPVTDTPTAA